MLFTCLIIQFGKICFYFVYFSLRYVIHFSKNKIVDTFVSIIRSLERISGGCRS